MFIRGLNIFGMIWFAVKRGPRRGRSRLQESFSLAEGHYLRYFVVEKGGKMNVKLIDQGKNIGVEKINGLGKD